MAEHVFRQGPGMGALAGAMPDVAELAGLVAGARLIEAGWPRRVGWTVHCARCGYEQDRRGPLVVVCPECGGPWRWLGWFRIGRVVSRPRELALGALLWALSGAAAAVLP